MLFLRYICNTSSPQNSNKLSRGFNFFEKKRLILFECYKKNEAKKLKREIQKAKCEIANRKIVFLYKKK